MRMNASLQTLCPKTLKCIRNSSCPSASCCCFAVANKLRRRSCLSAFGRLYHIFRQRNTKFGQFRKASKQECGALFLWQGGTKLILMAASVSLGPKVRDFTYNIFCLAGVVLLTTLILASSRWNDRSTSALSNSSCCRSLTAALHCNVCDNTSDGSSVLSSDFTRSGSWGSQAEEKGSQFISAWHN